MIRRCRKMFLSCFSMFFLLQIAQEIRILLWLQLRWPILCLQRCRCGSSFIAATWSSSWIGGSLWKWSPTCQGHIKDSAIDRKPSRKSPKPWIVGWRLVGLIHWIARYGFDVVKKFLDGARAMDLHFKDAPMEKMLGMACGRVTPTDWPYAARRGVEFAESLLSWESPIESTTCAAVASIPFEASVSDIIAITAYGDYYILLSSL